MYKRQVHKLVDTKIHKLIKAVKESTDITPVSYTHLDVYKRQGKTEILKHINVSFEKGKIHGLIGRNGSGKAMLMKCICGFIKPTSGEIIVDLSLIHIYYRNNEVGICCAGFWHGF